MKNELDKVHHILQEMVHALALAQACEDDFAARTVARHVAVRAADFVAIGRQLRRPINAYLRKANKIVPDEVVAFEDLFDEYLGTIRDKLSAHVQDLDFGRRLELWSTLNLELCEFFVTSASEVYNRMGKLALPDYMPLTSSGSGVNASDIAAVTEAPEGFFVGNDSLALSRSNTTGILNSTLIHQRAQQLKLIETWFDVSWRLLALFPTTGDPARRIIVSRLVTDVVSYADLLLGRHDGPPEAQIDGVWDILNGEGKPPSNLINFRTTFRLDEMMASLRTARNAFGGHFDTDKATALHTTLRQLDALDVNELSDIAELLMATFSRVCLDDVHYLRMYAGPSATRLYGVLGLSENPLVAGPFNDSAAPPLDVQPEEQCSALERYIATGDEEADSEVWGELSSAKREAERVELDANTHSTNPRTVVLTPSHLDLADLLGEELRQVCGEGAADREVTLFRALHVVERQTSGFPDAAGETLARAARAADRDLPTNARSLLRRVVAQTALRLRSAPVGGLHDLLVEWWDDPSPSTSIAARAAVASMLMRPVDSARANRKPDPYDLREVLASLIPTKPDLRLGWLVVLAAQLLEHQHMFGNKLGAEFASVCEELVDAAVASVTDREVQRQIRLAAKNSDPVGVGGLVVDAASSDEVSALLRELARVGLLATPTPTTQINLVVLLDRAGEADRALALAECLASRYPTWTQVELLRIALLVKAGEKQQAQALLSRLRRWRELSAEEEGRVIEIEQALAE